MKPIRALKRRQAAIHSPLRAYVAAAGRLAFITLFGLAAAAVLGGWWLGY